MWVYYLVFFTGVSNTLDPEAMANSLSPKTHAKITVGLQTATLAIGGVEKYYKDVTTALNGLNTEATNYLQMFARQQRALKAVRALGAIMKGLGAVSAIAGFIFTFFLPTALDVAMKQINKRFDEVNLKLNGISNKMERMSNEIKSSVELNTFLVNYVEWDSDIKNGAVKLKETREGFSKTVHHTDRVKLAEDYLSYYDIAKVHGNKENIFRAVHDPSTGTHKNIFELFIKEKGCDVSMLTRLYAYLQNLFSSVAEQTVTYYQFKGMSHALQDSLEDIYDQLYGMQQSFDQFVFRCRRDSYQHAKKKVVDLLDGNPADETSVLANKIFETLSSLFPWYAWAVAFTNDKVGTEICAMLHIFKTECGLVRELENKGDQFFRIFNRGEKDRSVVIAYQYVNEKPTCIGRENSGFVVFFQLCDGCSSSSVKVSENMLSKSSCGNSRFRPVPEHHHGISVSTDHRHHSAMHVVKNYPKFYVRGWMKHEYSFIQEYDTYHWISGLQYNHKPCDNPNVCKNEGICHAIPATAKVQCFCKKFYDGEHCETRFSVDDKINDLIATSRNDFGITTGVPTLVDLYFQLKTATHNLKSILVNIEHLSTKISSQVEFNKVLIQHNIIIRHANYVAKKYASLSNGEISISTFVGHMDGFLHMNTFDYIYGELYNIITGKGFADRSHFLQEYKTYIASSQESYVCTTNYANKIDDLSNNFLALDHAILEAYLVYLQMKANSASENEEQSLFAKAQQTYNGAGSRAKEYKELWLRTSCPTLKTEDMINNACSNISSYIGMTVEILCNYGTVANVPLVSCVMENNALKWSAEPSCTYSWEEWQSWSKCCRGQRYRHRNCSGSRCLGKSQDLQSCEKPKYSERQKGTTPNNYFCLENTDCLSHNCADVSVERHSTVCSKPNRGHNVRTCAPAGKKGWQASCTHDLECFPTYLKCFFGRCDCTVRGYSEYNTTTTCCNNSTRRGTAEAPCIEPQCGDDCTSDIQCAGQRWRPRNCTDGRCVQSDPMYDFLEK